MARLPRPDARAHDVFPAHGTDQRRNLGGVARAAHHLRRLQRGCASWYSVPCFVIMVVSIAFPFAWLRLRLGSVWPAAILHAAHNLFIQAFFDRVRSAPVEALA